MSEKPKEVGLIGGMEKRPIEIVDYDPLWSEKFQTHANAIAKALGNKALRIEHIGSTSVAELAAKPIIDILVVVADSADEDSYLPQMERAGYELRVREPDFYEHRMFRTRARDVHVHFYSPNSPEIERYLAFRDRLRKSAEDRKCYQETKRKLATQSWADMNAYAEAKTEVIERILAAARESGSSSSTSGCSASTNAYREDLAYIHDAGFGHLAREAAALLLKELRPSTAERGLVIDLGCGSGILAEQLANGGFDVLGIDLSSSLVTLARNRVPSGQFRVESLLTAQLPRCVAIAAVGECVNYLFDDRHSVEGVRQMLGRAFAALVPGGLLIFDVAEPGRVPGGASKTYIEAESWAVLVAAEEDPQHEFLTRCITTFRRAGELYRRDHEVHRLRLLPQEQVLCWLQDIGFQVETLNAYGTTRFPTGYVGFLARKPR